MKSYWEKDCLKRLTATANNCKRDFKAVEAREHVLLGVCEQFEEEEDDEHDSSHFEGNPYGKKHDESFIAPNMSFGWIYEEKETQYGRNELKDHCQLCGSDFFWI